MLRGGSVKQLGSQKQLVPSGASQKQLLQAAGKSGRLQGAGASQKQLLQGSGKSGRLGAKEPPPKSKACVIS